MQIVRYRDLCRELCKYGWTDREAVSDAELGGFTERVLHGSVDAPVGRGTFGCLADWKVLYNIDFGGWVKQWAVQKTRWQILTICTLYDVFSCKELPFGGRGDCSCVKILVALIFIRSLPRRWPSRLELRCVRPSVRTSVRPYVHKKFFRFPSNLVCG